MRRCARERGYAALLRWRAPVFDAKIVMDLIYTIEEAQKAIDAYADDAIDFELPISDGLLDPAGVNMAIVTDSILAKGWEPNGYIQKSGPPSIGQPGKKRSLLSKKTILPSWE